MNVISRNIIQSRAGGRTERCHNIPHNGSYNVAAHSWGVAMLMFYLWPQDFPRLAIHCLSHDVSEAWVGDIPSPTLKYTPGFKDVVEKLEVQLLQKIGLPIHQSLSVEDAQKLRACDQLEFWLWAKEQQAMGNQFVLEGIKEIERYFREQPLPEEAQKVFIDLCNSNFLPVQQGVIKGLRHDSE